MISSPGEVFTSKASGSGKEMARGVCPVGKVCGSLIAGVTRFIGTSCLDCDGFLPGALGLGASWGCWGNNWGVGGGVGAFCDRGSDIVERQSGEALGGVTHVCMWLECVGEDCGSGEGGCGVVGAGMGMPCRSERCARSVSHLLK